MTPAEAMQQHLAALSEDMAASVQAQTDISEAMTASAKNQKAIMDELVELRTEVQEMIGLFKNYVQETSNLRSEVRKMVAVGQR